MDLPLFAPTEETSTESVARRRTARSDRRPTASISGAAPSLTERLAAYFRARPNEWIDGLELASVAGSYAWRSRCSDLRKPKHGGMVIENRQVRVRRCIVIDGDDCPAGSYIRSEYRYVREA